MTLLDPTLNFISLWNERTTAGEADKTEQL